MFGSMPTSPYMQLPPGYPMSPQPSMQMPPQPRAPMPPQPTTPMVVLPPPAFAARGTAPDAPPPQRIVLPTPEALGIQVTAATPKAAAVDWNQVHARLDQLGIANFQRDRLAQGGFRVVLAVAGQQVEGTGTTEAAAMIEALQRAEAVARR